MRRYFINDPSARARDPEYHVVTREIDDLHLSKHEQFLKDSTIIVLPGARADHPGLQGRRHGGRRPGQRGGHPGDPHEAQRGED